MSWHGLHYKLTPAKQFLIISFSVLLGGMLIIGWWVGTRIEKAVMNETANTTSLYTASMIEPLLQRSVDEDRLVGSLQEEHFGRLLKETPLGERVVLFRLWSPDGTILYSTNAELIGEQLGLASNPELAQAVTGKTVSGLSSLDKPENALERGQWSTLIETYTPIHEAETHRVIAVAEFYQDAEPLQTEITHAKQQSWLVVVAATFIMYILLSGLVRASNRTIIRQRTQLQQGVDKLTVMLRENQNLHHRLQTAAARTTELNEQFLHRVGHDLHDGPAQDIALALLRIDELSQADATQLDTVRHALESALDEIRTLAAGLQLPELEPLQTNEVALHASRAVERKTNSQVKVSIDADLPPISLPQKIAIYRVICEGLLNAYHHAKAKEMKVFMRHSPGQIQLEICDNGSGFDSVVLESSNGRLGLVGMQQRIALLDGTFEVTSSRETGTHIYVSLPV